MQTLTIIIECGPTNYSAYSPDLPGCVAAHKTLSGVKAHMKEAIEIHLAGMAEDGIDITIPSHLIFTTGNQ
jgi:predicted RNase H-like HicB family nuclease